MYDKARTKGHVVPFELFGQGLGLCIKVKHARGKVANTGVTAVMDDLFEASSLQRISLVPISTDSVG